MKFLHTADWHIGQQFYNYDRTYEHEQFLQWLTNILVSEQIDVLLMSGDVFDVANPSAVSQKLFYRFLKSAQQRSPDLQIIITAGNHDSASRLEAPKPLLDSSHVHIIGYVERNEEGNIDYEKLLIPLSENGLQAAWCLAVPFLRMGDYPKVASEDNSYVAGVTSLYHEAAMYVKSRNAASLPVIALGHLHAQKATTSDMDRQERLIMGGIEGVPDSAFSQEWTYVALGHIHKAQKVGGRENVRYAGSPLPMSFSEINYEHKVILFDLEEGKMTALRHIKIPVVIPLERVPKTHQPLADVLFQLQQMPLANDKQLDQAPYLEVRILLNGPEPGVRHKVEEILCDKYARLAKIDVRYEKELNNTDSPTDPTPDDLDTLQPIDVFEKTYFAKYGGDVPAVLKKMFLSAAEMDDVL